MRTWFLAGIGLVVLTAAAQAQGDPTRSSFGFRLGGSQYHLGGATATGELAALVLTRSLERHLLVEGSLPILDDEQSTELAGFPASKRVSALLPEIGLQAQLPLGRVFPYVGGGAGGVIKLDGPGSSGFTAHLAGGLRVLIARRFDVQADVRRRWSSKWANWTMDYTLGLNWSR